MLRSVRGGCRLLHQADTELIRTAIGVKTHDPFWVVFVDVCDVTIRIKRESDLVFMVYARNVSVACALDNKCVEIALTMRTMRKWTDHIRVN